MGYVTWTERMVCKPGRTQKKVVVDYVIEWPGTAWDTSACLRTDLPKKNAGHSPLNFSATWPTSLFSFRQQFCRSWLWSTVFWACLYCGTVSVRRVGHVRYWTGTDGGALAGDGFIITSSDADLWRQLSRDVRLGSTIWRPLLPDEQQLHIF
jgi:hypothetical protein